MKNNMKFLVMFLALLVASTIVLSMSTTNLGNLIVRGNATFNGTYINATGVNAVFGNVSGTYINATQDVIAQDDLIGKWAFIGTGGITSEGDIDTDGNITLDTSLTFYGGNTIKVNTAGGGETLVFQKNVEVINTLTTGSLVAPNLESNMDATGYNITAAYLSG